MRRESGPPNKELKLAKPSISELRSVSPVFEQAEREVRCVLG